MNDTYTFATTAPTMTNGDVLNAITKLQNFAEEYEFVHIVGESDLALWQAVGEAQEQLFLTFHKPMFFVMEAAFPTPSEGGGAGPVLGGGTEEGDLTDWALEMEAKAKKVRNYNIQVVTAWGRLVKLDGSTKIVNLAGLVSGFYAKSLFEPLQRMIDAKEISAAEIILMEGHEETFIEDETMRTKIRYLSRGYIREVYINLARRRPSA